MRKKRRALARGAPLDRRRECQPMRGVHVDDVFRVPGLDGPAGRYQHVPGEISERRHDAPLAQHADDAIGGRQTVRCNGAIDRFP